MLVLLHLWSPVEEDTFEWDRKQCMRVFFSLLKIAWGFVFAKEDNISDISYEKFFARNLVQKHTNNKKSCWGLYDSRFRIPTVFFFFAGLYSLEYSARASNMPASTHSYTHLTSLCRHCDLWFNDDLRLFSYIDWALLASWLVFHCTYSWINSMMVWIISFVSFSDCCIHMTKIYAEDILTSKQGAHPFYMQHKERHG